MDATQEELLRNALSAAEPKPRSGVSCPKCGSDQVFPMTKGFGLGKAALGGLALGPVGLLAGVIGSKKVKVGCMGCGKSWKP